MDVLNIASVFWLFVLGASTGWVIGYFIGSEGVTIAQNILWGIGGAVLIGVMASWLQLGGMLLFSFLGTLATLFLANVFHHHHIEDVLGDNTKSIRILHHKKHTKSKI